MSDIAQSFHEHSEKAHIDAFFKGGKIIDIISGEEIRLREGCVIRVITALYNLGEIDAKLYQEKTRKKILDKGAELWFRFFVANGSQRLEFKVCLMDDLYLLQKGNQLGVADPCRCLIELENKNDKFEAESLNQAFFKASVKYRPNNKSHTCNVFKTFMYEGTPLDYLRW